ncbi:MBL fold metallo-hydrolase [Streptomyces sp. NPDC048636]|uniref:MBL fold metallo-hydrolase n=1 Tax=Streptomyces sp. NPDC048636 TaxID=3155762 RepID=UPI0034386D45
MAVLERIDAVMGATKPLFQHIVRGDDLWLWIDAGIAETPDQWILPALADRGLTPPARNLLVLTHVDVDHFGGLSRLSAALPNLTVIGHAADARLLHDHDELMRIRYDAFGEGGLPLPHERVDQLRDRAGAPVPADISLTEEARVHVGDEEWHILHLPGHTAGHLAVWNPASRVLIAGDAVMGRGVRDGDGRLQPPHVIDAPAYRATIERIRALAPAELRLSHEEVLTGPAVRTFLDDSLAALEAIGRAVAAARAGGVRRLADLCTAVASSTGGWPDAPPVAFAPTVEALVSEADG